MMRTAIIAATIRATWESDSPSLLQPQRQERQLDAGAEEQESVEGRKPDEETA